MASLRLPAVLLISTSIAVFSGCSVEEIEVPGPGGAVAGGPEGPVDPLDAAPEGEPICTREGWCWDFPYTPSSFSALHASAPDALWAVGTAGTILRSRSRGTAWRMMPTGVTADLYGVFAADKHTAWAVGDEGMLLAFDGAKWTRVPVPVESTATLRSVWASSPSDAWVVGSEVDPKTEREVGVVLHFDGHEWSRTSRADKVFPPLYAVHGKEAREVWFAGGSLEAPAVMRFNGIELTDVDVLALAGSRSVYGPAVGLWVSDRYDVLLTSGQINTSTVARYTGEWNVEASQLRDRAPLGAFGRGPDGAPIVVGNPPLKSDGKGKWVPVSENSYAGVSAIWAVDEEVTVMAGQNGLLETSGSAPPRPGAVIPTNLGAPWLLSDSGVFRFDASAKRWSRSLGPSEESNWYESFIDAVEVSDNDILVTSVMYPYDDFDGQIRPKYRTRQWDGTKWTLGALPENGNYSRGTVAKTKSGDVWIAQPGTGSPMRRTPSGAEIPLGKCAGDSSSVPYASFVWTAGDEVFLYGYRGIYRVNAAGACAMTPLTGSIDDKETFVTAAAVAPNDVWLVTRSSDAEGARGNVYRFDGASWQKVAQKTAQDIANVRVLEGGGTFVFGDKTLMTWDGTSLVDVATGLGEKEWGLSGMWGKSVGEAKFLGAGGRILAKKR